MAQSSGSGGSIDIQANHISSSNGHRLYVTNSGPGDGSISIEANSVSGGAGAMVHSSAFTDVDVNIGAITAQGQDFSLYGQAASGGPGTNVRLGGVTIENGRGVAIQQPNGDQVSLSVDALTVTGSGYGVFYYGSASAASTIEAKTIAGGDGSFGVHASALPTGPTTTGGALTINADSIDVGQYGIYAQSFAPLSVDVGSITAANPGGVGIQAMSYSLDPSPTEATGIRVGSIEAAQTGIFATGTRSHSVEVGSVTVTAGNGIDVMDAAPEASIDVNATDASAGQFAIATQS